VLFRSALERYLSRPDPSLHRFGIHTAAGLGGVVCVRYPWLRGAYLELIGLLPDSQGQGLGGQLMSWLTAETAAVEQNLWTLVSATNGDARRFYARHGFTQVGELDDLVRPGTRELMLRRRLGTDDATSAIPGPGR
jgi:ribosomal protein S18 acetylase RimI-like enzyme